jgi:hypothetical protein
MPSNASRWRVSGVILCALLPLAPQSAASATTSGLQSRVAAYLAAHPGGVPLNDKEISYGQGAFIVTLIPPLGVQGGVADCPSGWYCFYDGVDFGYPRGKLSSCGTQNLATWDWQYRAESAHYALSRGYTDFYYNGTSLFRVGVDKPAIANVGSYRNWANIVKRTC